MTVGRRGRALLVLSPPPVRSVLDPAWRLVDNTPAGTVVVPASGAAGLGPDGAVRLSASPLYLRVLVPS